MKALKYSVISAIILLLAVGCSTQVQVKESWWLQTKIEPGVMVLNNMAPEDFNVDWVYASFLSNSDVKALIAEDEYQKFIESPFSFGKIVDLNSNDADEAIHVGVYRGNNETQGIFLAIFEDGQLVSVLSDSTSQDFSALVFRNNELLWFRCMECVEYKKLIWNGSSYILE